MCSYEDRKRAVELYIQYGCRAAVVIRELGYPNQHSFLKWHKEYLEAGELHRKRNGCQRYKSKRH